MALLSEVDDVFATPKPERLISRILISDPIPVT